MTTTKTYQVYTFDELSEKAQKKALDNNRIFLVEDDDWYHNEYEVWKSKLKELGYSEPDISFSGFWNQGDGASFTSPVDLRQWIKAHKLYNKYRWLYVDADYWEFTINRTRWHGYVHSNTITVEHEYYGMDGGYPPDRDTSLQEFIKIMQQEIHDLSNDIYRSLQKEYEYQTSDEVLKNWFIENKSEFTKDGGSAIDI